MVSIPRVIRIFPDRTTSATSILLQQGLHGIEFFAASVDSEHDAVHPVVDHFTAEMLCDLEYAGPVAFMAAHLDEGDLGFVGRIHRVVDGVYNVNQFSQLLDHLFKDGRVA